MAMQKIPRFTPRSRRGIRRKIKGTDRIGGRGGKIEDLV